MSDGWIYESPCGCVLHEKPVGSVTFMVCNLAIASRLCGGLWALLRPDGINTTSRVEQHLRASLSLRESELCNESFTY